MPHEVPSHSFLEFPGSRIFYDDGNIFYLYCPIWLSSGLVWLLSTSDLSNITEALIIHFICFIYFSCTGFSLFSVGFLQLQQVESSLQLWCAGVSLQWLLSLQHKSTRSQQLWCVGLIAHGMWNHQGPGIEPVSPAAGRFLTT